MGLETRIRGQETIVRLARGNNVEATLTAIKDFTFAFQLEIKSEGYLGQTTMRKDDIFNGVSGGMTFDQEGQEILTFQDFLKRRAQRLIPVNQSRVNATVTLNFPNGQSPRVLIPDMKFGESPNSIPSRTDYVNTTFSYEAEDAKIITT